MRNISDPSRYERIPGSARRYLDLETGESISRREYDKRTKVDDVRTKVDDVYYDDVYDGDDDDYYQDIVSAGGSTRE